MREADGGQAGVMGRQAGVTDGGVRLVVDTCGREARVGVVRGTEVLAERQFAGRGAAERVVEEMRAAMAEAGVGMGEVGSVVVVRGPGSFTGVRVGLAAGKGMAEGLGVGLVGVSRLAVLAGGEDGVAVLEAGRGEGFWGRFEDGACVAEGVGPVEEATFAEAGAGLGAAAEREVTVAAVAQAAWGREAEDPMRVDGLYLRRTAEELLDRQKIHRERKAGV